MNMYVYVWILLDHRSFKTILGAALPEVIASSHIRRAQVLVECLAAEVEFPKVDLYLSVLCDVLPVWYHYVSFVLLALTV